MLAADYFDETDHRKRENINAALQELEASGIVSLTWPRFRQNIEADRVYLEFDGVQKAYCVAGITPKADKLVKLRYTIAPLEQHPWDWVRRWWQETDAQLQLRKSAGLDVDSPEGYRLLVLVLQNLPELKDSTPKRVFSQNVLGDSKKFELEVESHLLRLLRDQLSQEYETPEEYLDSVNLVTHPKLTLVSGDLAFKLQGNTVELKHFEGSLGLSSQTIAVLEVSRLPSAPLLLVENLTTYHQVVHRSSPTWGAIIYAGGFPHKGTQLLLSKIAAFTAAEASTGRQTDVYHWGDIDYGGLHIFEYLHRNFFPHLKPYAMDVTTYMANLHLGIAFSQDYGRKLADLLANDLFQNWHHLLTVMLQEGHRLEQEALCSIGEVAPMC